MTAVLLEVLHHWPPFDLLSVVSMSNHDRRGLLLGRNLLNNPTKQGWPLVVVAVGSLVTNGQLSSGAKR
jgi:hypothetical protein